VIGALATRSIAANARTTRWQTGKGSGTNDMPAWKQVPTTPPARTCRRKTLRLFSRQSSAPATAFASRAITKSRPTFSPGVDNYFLTGAVTEKWDAEKPLADRLTALLSQPAVTCDRRDDIGFERKGRLQAAAIARRVQEEAARV
jgi:hypothetical protein